MTSDEFQQFIKRGQITKVGKKLVLTEDELSPEFISTLDKIDSLFIPGEVYSSKNSKQIFMKSVGKSKWKFNGKPCIPFITDSAPVKKYKKEVKRHYKSQLGKFLEMIDGKMLPVVVEFTFARKTKGRFDFNNMTELVQDMMVNCGWLPDDDIRHILPIPPLPPKEPFLLSKDDPGVYIRVL